MRRNAALIVVFLLLIAGISFAEFLFVETDPNTLVPELVPNESAEQNAVDEPVEIIISACGDLTLGGNMKTNPKSTMYTQQLARHDNDLSYFYANVRDIFEADDLTIVNFEGTLTNIAQPPGNKQNNEFLFRAPPEHVQILTLNGIEAVALENNHIMDFGERGYLDTVAALTSAGVVYASDGDMGVYQTNGVSIALLAYQTINIDGVYDRLFERVPIDVAAARAEHDLVIVSYHWGREKDYAPNANQIKLGRLTIDAGADLVLGHHSHRINPIECYNGKYIVYSLSNSSFSGNARPSDMDTFIFQQKFTVAGGGSEPGPFRIIPCSMSSVTAESGSKSGDNDLAFTPFPAGSPGIARVINKMKENGKGLHYAVDHYPTEWQ